MKFSFNSLIIACLIFFITHKNLMGQDELPIGNPAMLTFQLGFGIDYPLADMADRFGRNDRFNLGLEWKTENNLAFGLEFSYYYGSNVKDSILKGIQTTEGRIYGYDGLQSDVFLRERAAYLGLVGAKLFPLDKNGNYSIRLGLGAGLFYNKVRILDETRAVSQFFGDYHKGYDRLNRGPAIKQQLGFECHSNKLHFNVCFEALEGFTKNVRTINFDTGQSAAANNLDMLFGIRLNWMLPLIKQDNRSADNIYY